MADPGGGYAFGFGRAVGTLRMVAIEATAPTVAFAGEPPEESLVRATLALGRIADLVQRTLDSLWPPGCSPEEG